MSDLEVAVYVMLTLIAFICICAIFGVVAKLKSQNA